MKRWLLVFLLTAFLEGCTTWEAYDRDYDPSLGFATLIQEVEPMMFLNYVDDKQRGAGAIKQIKISPGTHVLGFNVNPLFYELIPTDPNEEYNFFTGSLSQWVSFNAQSGKTYQIVTPFTKGNKHAEAQIAVIVDIESDKVISELVGNYLRPPKI